MKIYINSSVDLNPSEYIGGKLHSIGSESNLLGRGAEIFNAIYAFSPNILVYQPALLSMRYTLWENPGFEDIVDLMEIMLIKDGTDLIDHQTYLEFIGYCSGHTDIALLYPISESKIDELQKIMDSLTSDETYSGYALDDAVAMLLAKDSKTLGTNDEHMILQHWG